MTDLDRLAAHFRTLIEEHRRDEAAFSAESAVLSHIAAAAMEEALQCVLNVQAGKRLSSEIAGRTDDLGGLYGDAPLAEQIGDEGATQGPVECSHAHIDYEPSDPSVGIFGEAFICEDCGADVTDEKIRERDDAYADAQIARWERSRENG